MLRSLKDLENYEIGATDGAIGHVKDFYVDDQAWVLRYLVVDTGTWLRRRDVLISPWSVGQPDWAAKRLPVSITREAVRLSPGIDTDKPVSQQNESAYLGYYGLPEYWGGVGLWGGSDYPDGFRGDLASAADYRHEPNTHRANSWHEGRQRKDDHHLRSARLLSGNRLHATNGELGHVQDMLFDEGTWSIRYFVANTSNWWIGHQVLVAPQWITQVRWADETVEIDLAREDIRSAPPFESTAALNRASEVRLYEHYRRPGYWPSDTAPRSTISSR